MSVPTSSPSHWVRWRRWLSWTVVLGLGVVLIGSMQNAPSLGTANGRLEPCPAAANCVCSHDAEAPSGIAPLRCPGPTSGTEELARLREIVRAQPRTRLLDERSDYLRFEVTTALLRFRDDLEFLADDGGKVIHVRSASRIGRSDLGTNRRRVERIRALFTR